MLKKMCPKCQKPSYSSCADGVWLCPTCNHDLNHVKHQLAESRKGKPQLYIIKNSELKDSSQPQPEITPYIFKSFD